MNYRWSLLIVIGFWVGSSSIAQTTFKGYIPKFYSSHFCRTQAVEKIRQELANPIWIRELLPIYGVQTFRASTGTVGRWIELRGDQRRVIELRKMSPETTESFRWDSSGSCKVTHQIVQYERDSLKLFDSFTDQKLISWIQAHRRGIIYAWSPSMPFSLDGMTAIREAAASLQMDIKFVLDPHADVVTARTVYGRSPAWFEPMERMESVELFQRGMGSHYPAILVISDGKIRGMSVPGVKRPKVYERIIRQRLRLR